MSDLLQYCKTCDDIVEFNEVTRLIAKCNTCKKSKSLKKVDPVTGIMGKLERKERLARYNGMKRGNTGGY